MEKKNIKLKNNFTQLITQISKLYKEVSISENEDYTKGKKEAYEEILAWFTSTHNQEYKYVSSNALFQILQEKLTKVKSSLNDQEEGINLNEIKISDNRKRLRTTEIEPLILDEPSSLLNNIDLTNNQSIHVKKKKFK